MKFLFLSLLLASSTWAAEKYCFLKGEPSSALHWIVSANLGGPLTAFEKTDLFYRSQIHVRQTTDPSTLFTFSEVHSGDCVLLNPVEKQEITVKTDSSLPHLRIESTFYKLRRWFSEAMIKKSEKKELYPVIYFSKKFQSKQFGWMDPQVLSLFTKTESPKETSVDAILNYSVPKSNLTLLYLICPSNRDEVCELTIKKNGKWILGKGHQKLKIPVLARSKRINMDRSYRLRSESDTPQGIYPLFATLYSENLGFGKLPRFDLDALLVPINGWNYPMFSELLSQIVPAKVADEYWANEWPLAYAIGRTLIRIHANSLENAPSYTTPQSHQTFIATRGCLNLVQGQMQLLLKTLADLGVLTPNQASPVANPDPKTLEWKAAAGLGRTFVIVKDQNSF